MVGTSSKSAKPYAQEEDVPDVFRVHVSVRLHAMILLNAVLKTLAYVRGLRIKAYASRYVI